MEKIGFLTTIPVEIIIASGNIPVDLNNIFITAENPNELILHAENIGFPRNYCSWVKGIFSVAKANAINKVVAVREGECTYSEKLSEMLHYQGIQCIPFSYPHTRNYERLKLEMETLSDNLHVRWDDVIKTKTRILNIRKMLRDLDRMSYENTTIAGRENYIWLISSTDFNGNVALYEQKLIEKISEIKQRKNTLYASSKRIGLIGIPPIVNNIFEAIEQLNGVVLFNEMPRQFSMPHYEGDIVDQYLQFTYPYSIDCRLRDIQSEIKNRELDGIIHYVQSFCPRQIDDTMLRKHITIPFLTIECDAPGSLDERNMMRLEAFFERWQ